MKKSLRLLSLAVLAVVGILPAHSAQSLKFYTGGIVYQVTDEEAKTVMTTYTIGVKDEEGNAVPKYTGDVVVPATVTYDNVEYTVTSIGDFTFFKGSGSDANLTSVTLPETIVSLGMNSFGSSSITSLTIPSSVKIIGNSAFERCAGLTSVTIPDGVESVGNNCFIGTKIENITFPNSVTIIGMNCCAGVSSLTKAVVGDGVKAIPASCFADCTGLVELSLGNSVEEIYPLALSGCSALETLHLPATLQKFGDRALINMTNFKSFTVDPASEYLTAVDGVLFSKDMKTIYKYPLGLTASSYTIPPGVENIADCCFDHQAHFTSVNFPASLKTIGKYAFWDNDAVETFDLSATQLESVDEGGFTDCSKVKSFKFPDTLKKLEALVFYWNGEVTSIDLGNGVESLGDKVFMRCYALKNMYIPATVNYIGSDIFAECESLEGFTVDPENENFCEVDNVLYTKNMDKLLVYLTSLPAESFTVPESVETIYFMAFAESNNLKKLHTGMHTKTIEAYAFQNCINLEEIWFGPDLESLGEGFMMVMKDRLESKVKEIYCMAATPPQMAGNFPGEIWETAILYVPEASLDEYKANSRWKRIKDMRPFDFASVTAVSDDVLTPSITVENGVLSVTNASEMSVYTVAGSLIYSGPAKTVDNLPAGIYVVKAGDEVAKIRL